MKPVIGIIAKSHTTYTDRTCMCALDGYRRAVSNCGGVPILIMPTQDICFEETRPREARKLTEEEQQAAGSTQQTEKPRKKRKWKSLY